MQNERRIVELLAEMLIKHDVFIDELRNVKNELVGVKGELVGVKNELVGVKGELVGVNQRLDQHSTILKEHAEILTRHERLLKRNDSMVERILELLSEDVIRFEEILDVEQLEGGKRIVLHKSKYASNI